MEEGKEFQVTWPCGGEGDTGLQSPSLPSARDGPTAANSSRCAVRESEAAVSGAGERSRDSRRQNDSQDSQPSPGTAREQCQASPVRSEGLVYLKEEQLLPPLALCK